MLSLLEITRKGGCGASPNGLLMECDDESSQLTVYLTFFRELSKSGNHMGDVLPIKKAAFLPLLLMRSFSSPKADVSRIFFNSN